MNNNTNRSEFIGASEVAALLNCHPFKTPLDIFNEKMGLSEDRKTSKSASLGNHLEIGLLNFFCEEYFKSTYSNYQTHLREGHAGATLDAILVNGSYKRRKFDFAPIDIKTIGYSGEMPYHKDYGKGGSDEVPLHVFYQLQMQMHLTVVTTDVSKISDGFIGLLDMQGRGTLVYRIPYQQGIGEMLLETVESFWTNHIEPKTPPKEGEALVEILF